MGYTFIAVPLNLGAVRYGVEQGPLAVWRELQERAYSRQRDPQLRAHLDMNRITVPGDDRLRLAHALGIDQDNPHEHPAFVDAVASVCDALAGKVAACASVGDPFVVVGGDHAIAMGTVAGLRRVYRKIGLIYIDAHADLNTWAESSSKRIHGMAAGAILGRDGAHPALLNIDPPGQKVAPENVVQIALRDLEWGEKEYLSTHRQVLTRTILDVERVGIAAIAEEALSRLEHNGLDGVHISLDIDALDPAVAPGTGLPVVGGLTAREIELLLLELCRQQDRVKILSFEIAEINPVLDTQNKTAALAARLISRFFGEDIAFR